MSRSRAATVAWILFALLVAAPLPASAGGITFLESRPFEHTDVDDQGLGGARAVAVKPDDEKFVYVVSRAGLSLWARDLVTGRLTFVEAHIDDELGVDGIDGGNGIAVAEGSTGNYHVYVSGGLDDAVGVFASNDLTGVLTFVGYQQDNGGPGHPPSSTIRGPTAIVVSPDGAHVYLTAGQSQTVTVFERNALNGSLTYGTSYQTTNDVPPYEGLDHPRGITISPDGKFVYVTAHRTTPGGETDGTVVVFARDDDPISATYGALAYQSLARDNQGTPLVQRLKDPQQLVVSPDSHHLYVASMTGNALVAFTRDSDGMSPTHGDLTYLDSYVDGGLIAGLGNAWGVTIGPDGKYVYVTGRNERAVNVFIRDSDDLSPTFGKLGFIESQVSPENKNAPKYPYACIGGPNNKQACHVPSECPGGTCSGDRIHGLVGPGFPAVAPGNANLYVTGEFSGSIVTFAIDYCGNGKRGTDEECDDVRAVCVACELVVCGASPAANCSTVHTTSVGNASVAIKNDPLKSDAKDALQWQWKKGNVLAAAFADPTAPATADYAVCVYDRSGNSQPLASRVAPSGTGWIKKLDGDGNLKEYKYKVSTLRPAGIEELKLKPGLSSKAQVTMKGKSYFLQPPALAPAIPGPAGLVMPVTVSVKNTANGECFEATYDGVVGVAPKRIKRNDAAQFKGKSN